MTSQWQVEYTDEFGRWWDTLEADVQEDIAVIVRLLENRGPSLPFPFSSQVRSSRYGGMRELRIQSRGVPIRVFYVFDRRRVAVLLIGGVKTGTSRFYETHVP